MLPHAKPSETSEPCHPLPRRLQDKPSSAFFQSQGKQKARAALGRRRRCGWAAGTQPSLGLCLGRPRSDDPAWGSAGTSRNANKRSKSRRRSSFSATSRHDSDLLFYRFNYNLYRSRQTPFIFPPGRTQAPPWGRLNYCTSSPPGLRGAKGGAPRHRGIGKPTREATAPLRSQSSRVPGSLPAL